MAAIFTFFVWLSTVFLLQDASVAELRQLLFEGSANEDKAHQLFEKVGDYKGSDPVLIGYKGAAFALKAKYGFNPVGKLKHIKTAQKYFNDAVAAAPENMEVRFLRYSVEAQTPKMIDLSAHVPEDQALLMEGLRKYPKSNFTPETARITRDYMVQHCTCNEQEKEFLKKLKL